MLWNSHKHDKLLREMESAAAPVMISSFLLASNIKYFCTLLYVLASLPELFLAGLDCRNTNTEKEDRTWSYNAVCD